MKRLFLVLGLVLLIVLQVSVGYAEERDGPRRDLTPDDINQVLNGMRLSEVTSSGEVIYSNAGSRYTFRETDEGTQMFEIRDVERTESLGTAGSGAPGSFRRTGITDTYYHPINIDPTQNSFFEFLSFDSKPYTLETNYDGKYSLGGRSGTEIFFSRSRDVYSTYDEITASYATQIGDLNEELARLEARSNVGLENEVARQNYKNEIERVSSEIESLSSKSETLRSHIQTIGGSQDEIESVTTQIAEIENSPGSDSYTSRQELTALQNRLARLTANSGVDEEQTLGEDYLEVREKDRAENPGLPTVIANGGILSSVRDAEVILLQGAEDDIEDEQIEALGFKITQDANGEKTYTLQGVEYKEVDGKLRRVNTVRGPSEGGAAQLTDEQDPSTPLNTQRQQTPIQTISNSDASVAELNNVGNVPEDQSGFYIPPGEFRGGIERGQDDRAVVSSVLQGMEGFNPANIGKNSYMQQSRGTTTVFSRDERGNSEGAAVRLADGTTVGYDEFSFDDDVLILQKTEGAAKLEYRSDGEKVTKNGKLLSDTEIASDDLAQGALAGANNYQDLQRGKDQAQYQIARQAGSGTNYGFFYDLGTVSGWASGFDGFSYLFMDGEQRRAWQTEVQEAFKPFTTAGWIENICFAKVDKPPQGTAYVKLPNGLGLDVATTISAECARQPPFAGVSENIYKIVGFVQNPIATFNELPMRFDLIVSGPSGTKNVLAEKKTLERGERFDLTGSNAFVQTSPNDYDTVCVIFDTPPPFYESNKVCNVIECRDVGTTGYSSPPTSPPSPYSAPYAEDGGNVIERPGSYAGNREFNQI